MGQYMIEGGNRLYGSVRVQGAKNSALPILAATVAVGVPCVIHNCPDLTDIDSTVKILKSLGCEVHRSVGSVSVDSSHISSNCISDTLMREMRSSIIFLGALISGTGEAVMTAPGGCDIGLRPIDLHLTAMQKLGIRVTEEHGQIRCSCQKVRGNKITLSFPSVGATENIILASVKASGVTTIINAAREPEIVDLAMFLNSCGARISGAGDSTIVIEGVERLHSVQYAIMPDRIVACTYMAAAAVTSSSIIIDEVIPSHLVPVFSCFEQTGCRIETAGNKIRITSPQRLRAPETIRTMPYPGFPTDCQAIMMSVASVADGITLINENIFENRFKHVAELNRMGADIRVHDKVAVVNGVSRLQGTRVHSTDLRAGAALVLAGLCADGVTTVDSICYIDRGYDSLAKNLSSMGAKIKRKD
ncbi:MAG: UDP-N-acetylglucosamine 1-carboxyvinyltransferase [Clostridia bacterium]|nr:UDP-N-acetylglucosamine 1-carboxyvinyltransferase [Clostridia bacterium]